MQMSLRLCQKRVVILDNWLFRKNFYNSNDIKLFIYEMVIT